MSLVNTVVNPIHVRNSRTQNNKFSDITQAVGLTPIVRLRQLHPVVQRTSCWLKLESCNPGGSIKEKNATYLVNQAEKLGQLRKGGTIIESSSGNFGVALSIIGAARGYRVIIVVDSKTTEVFRKMMLAYGTTLETVSVELCDAAGSMQKARMLRARELAEQIPGSWYPCQHTNPHNSQAHAVYTGKEIERSFGKTLDAVVVGVSTAGQIMGTASYLKSKQPSIKIIAVDVEGSIALGGSPKPYKMTGVGLSFIPPNLDSRLIDSCYQVSESLSYSVCHQLAQKEGMLLGASTGAIVAAGIKVALNYPRGANILMINPDRGDRYLDTVYNHEWLAENNFQLFDLNETRAKIGQLTPLNREPLLSTSHESTL